MKVVVKKVGKIGEVQEIENSLKVLQYLVGGYIQTFPIVSDMLIVCNEEGRMMGLEPNVEIVVGQHRELIVGDFIIVKHGDEDFESLDDNQLERLRKSGMIK